MTGPQQHPRWRATEVGPGGLAPDQVRPIVAEQAHRPGRPDAPTQYRPEPTSGHESTGPAAVFGSFEDEHRRPGWSELGWFSVAVAVAVVVAASLWSTTSPPTDASGDLRPGDCLSSSAGTAVTPVDCSSPDVEFRIAARYDGSTDSTRCSAVSSDLVLVTRDDAVLCLNYLASVGECLYAGAARDVGKAPCRTPGTASTPVGLFRVIAVLTGTVDVRDCPIGTVRSLVHPTSKEVLCLGLP